MIFFNQQVLWKTKSKITSLNSVAGLITMLMYRFSCFCLIFLRFLQLFFFFIFDLLHVPFIGCIFFYLAATPTLHWSRKHLLAKLCGTIKSLIEWMKIHYNCIFTFYLLRRGKEKKVVWRRTAHAIFFFSIPFIGGAEHGLFLHIKTLCSNLQERQRLLYKRPEPQA